MNRRRFLQRAVLGAGAAGMSGLALPAAALKQTAQPGPGPYGSLDGRSPDDYGVIVPDGFTVRLVAAGDEPVFPTDYRWHRAADGAACFPTPGGGWNYVCNAEVRNPGGGGVSAIEFDADGNIVDARSILSGTFVNCAGGPTPWGTWLSCEEFDLTGGASAPEGQPAGMVWETDPTGQEAARPLPALGLFSHEAAAIDPVAGTVYLTEDQPDGHLYRFTPDAYPDLSTGLLEAAVVDDAGAVDWLAVPDPSAASGSVRTQLPDATAFQGGEGIWYHDGVVFFSTKFDGGIHAVHLADQRYELVYDQRAFDEPVLDKVDNVVVDPGSGDVYVAEDGSNPLELVIITPEREVAVFARVVGGLHEGSEITGPCFSPDGARMYFSSQRGGGINAGMTFEVSGPFRGQAAIASAAATPTPESEAEPTATPTAAAEPTAAPTAEPSAETATPPPTPAPTATIAAAADEAATLRGDADDGNMGGSGIGPIAVTGIGVGVVAVGGAAAWALRRRAEGTTEEP